MSDQIPSFFVESKRFWGIFITGLSQLVPVLAPIVGVDVTAADVVTFGEAVSNAIYAIGTVAGLALSAWGSMDAQGPMTLRRT